MLQNSIQFETPIQYNMGGMYYATATTAEFLHLPWVHPILISIRGMTKLSKHWVCSSLAVPLFYDCCA